MSYGCGTEVPGGTIEVKLKDLNTSGKVFVGGKTKGQRDKLAGITTDYLNVYLFSIYEPSNIWSWVATNRGAI